MRRATATLRPAAAELQGIVELNRGPLLVESVEVHPLTPRQVEQACDAGALVVDVRTDLQFDEAHIPGSVSITALRAGFGSKLAWLAEPRPARSSWSGRDDEDARHAAGLAASVGVTHIAGFLAGGMTSWREERRPVERIERITSASCASARARPSSRSSTSASAASGTPATSRARSTSPYHDIHDFPDGLDPERPVAVICGSGQRSAPAASLLRRYGASEVLHVVDGGVRDYISGRCAEASGSSLSSSRSSATRTMRACSRLCAAGSPRPGAARSWRPT